MSTYMAKAENIDRKWYLIDAAGKPLGRTAAEAAVLLNGKNRADYTPHVDCGAYVIIINAEKAVLTGYIGGLKEVQYQTLMATRPELAMELAVKGMLPKNSIGAKSFTRLKVYRGPEHNHQAQKPELL